MSARGLSGPAAASLRAADLGLSVGRVGTGPVWRWGETQTGAGFARGEMLRVLDGPRPRWARGTLDGQLIEAGSGPIGDGGFVGVARAEVTWERWVGADGLTAATRWVWRLVSHPAAHDPLWVEIVPASAEVRARLVARGLRRVSGGVDAAVVAAAGLHGARRGVEIDPMAPTPWAVATILGALMRDLHAEDPAVRAGDQPSALHRWRVALRAARAVLGLFGGALGGGRVRDTKAALRRWQAKTGAARDLDVLVGRLNKRDELGPVIAALEPSRAAAQEVVRRLLDGPKFAREVEQIGRLLVRAEAAPADRAEPFGLAVRSALWRAWTTLERGLRALHPEVEDEALHDVRKAGKALRYVLELGRAVLPASAATALLAELRALQDALGALQDATVQAGLLAALPVADPTAGVALVSAQERASARHAAARQDALKAADGLVGRAKPAVRALLVGEA